MSLLQIQSTWSGVRVLEVGPYAGVLSELRPAHPLDSLATQGLWSFAFTCGTNALKQLADQGQLDRPFNYWQ